MKGLRGFALIILLILTGCSGNGIESPNIPTSGSDNPVAPGYVVPGYPCPETGGSDRNILAIGTIDINPDTLTSTFLPDRELAKHWDVTPMLMPPHCNDCVKIEVLEFKPAEKYIKLKISVKNPTNLTGYDVRGIAVVPSADVRLLNADGWTGLWDDGGDVTRNPFKAFAIDWADHEIQPGTAHSRKYEFTYSTLSQLAGGTQVVIDASWPLNCREAYWFDAVQQEGHIDGETSSADFSVSLTPLDWQGNISTVLIDLTEIGGGIEPMIQNGNSWEFAYEASVVVPDNQRANIWVEVVDEINPVRAYWLFEIGIVSEDPLLPSPTGLYASPGQVFVDLTWDAIDDPDVIGVNLYSRTKGNGFEFGYPLNPSPITGKKFKDTDVSRNVMYFYTARAVGLDDALGPPADERGAKPFEWGEPFQLSDLDGITSTTPGVDIGPDGKTHVYWYDYRNGLFSMKSLFYDIVEENYTPDIDILSNASYEPDFVQGYGKLFVSWDNIVHIVFDGVIPDVTEGTDILYVWFDEPYNISYPIIVSIAPYGGFTYVHRDADLDTHFIYFDYNPTPPPNVVPNSKYLDSDFIFSEPVIVQVSVDNVSDWITSTVDSSGEFHTAFFRWDPMGIYYLWNVLYARTVDGVWQPVEQATFYEEHNGMAWPSIGASDSGRVIISVWGGGGGGTGYIMFNDGDGWTTPQETVPSEYVWKTNGYEMAVDADGVANLIMSRMADEIVYLRWYDGQFSDVVLITDGHADPYFGGPSRALIRSGDNGAATAVWIDRKHQDGGYGSEEIWACQMIE